MRTGIVTVYNGDNYGAFWQAMALKGWLTEHGQEAFIVRHNARNPKIRLLKDVVRLALKGKLTPKNLRFTVDHMKVFKKAWEGAGTCSVNEAKNADLIILGSDEIWNVRRGTITRYPIFSGAGFDGKKISYAVSVNRAGAADFDRHPVFTDNIRKLDAISVRDRSSAKVISEVTGREDISICVDPTLLQDRKFYEERMGNRPEEEPYILVYSYAEWVSSDVISQLKTAAAKRNLKLVSILKPLAWCERNVTADAGEMLSWFVNAEYIATDTFHGLMFSLIFQKHFLVISKATPKFRNALREFNVSERLEEEDIQSQMAQEPDYDRIGYVIEQRRQQSAAYLERKIEELT